MDYGKLAYLKALDLEGRLGIKRDNFGVLCLDKKAINSGRTFLTQIEGSGDIAVFVNCSVNADFFVGDKKVASGQNVFFAYNGGSIYVECDTAIEKLSIIAVGNVKNALDQGIACADLSGSYIAYVINKDGKAEGYLHYIPSGSNSLFIDEGYVHGDVCALNDEFIFAMVVPSGRVDLISSKGKLCGYEIGASSVAISCFGGVFYVAYIKKSAIYYFILRNFGDKSSPVKLAYSGPVDEIRLTKRGSGLSFSSGGKCYFKELGASDTLSDKLYVTFGKEVV